MFQGNGSSSSRCGCVAGDRVLLHDRRDLAEDLGRREVAPVAGDAGEAERALERAAGLRRDADRPPVVLGQVDGLDRRAVREAEQVLPRAVERERPLRDLRPAQLVALVESGPQALRQVRHRARSRARGGGRARRRPASRGRRARPASASAAASARAAHPEEVRPAHPAMIARARVGPLRRRRGGPPMYHAGGRRRRPRRDRETTRSRWTETKARSRCVHSWTRAAASPTTARRPRPARTSAPPKPSCSSREPEPRSRPALRVAIPPGHVGLVWPRSGLAVRHGIDTLAGVIDSDYRGEVRVVLVNHGARAVPHRGRRPGRAAPRAARRAGASSPRRLRSTTRPEARVASARRDAEGFAVLRARRVEAAASARSSVGPTGRIRPLRHFAHPCRPGQTLRSWPRP